MARPNVRVRTVMMLVSLIALGLWGERMRRRRAYCLEKSIEHRSKLFVITFHGKHDPLPPEVEEMWRRRSLHAAWHLAVSDVYLGCACHPWRPVPPEPPEPVDFPAGQAPSR